jgi:hypothetical protein
MTGSGRGTGLQERLQFMTQVDKVLDRMVASVTRVKNSQGSLVSLPKAELDLLAQIELARDLMMEALKNQSDRTQLREIFGGSCARLVRIRAVCESIEFSDMNKSDQRLPTCLRACQSVEKVIIDLGDGEALRKAQASLAAAIKEGSSFDVLSESVAIDSTTGFQQSELSSPPDSARSAGRRDPAESAAERNAERLLFLVRADAERTEAQLRGELAACRESVEKEILSCDNRLQEDLAGFQDSLQTIVDKWEERLSSCESKLDLVPLDLAKHKSDTQDSARQTQDKLEERLSSCESKLEQVPIESARRAQELQSSFQASVGDLESRLAEMERALERHSSESRHLQSKVEEMSKCIGQLTQKQQEGEAHLSSLDSSIARLEENWSNLSASGQDAREGLAGIRRSLEKQVADSAAELQSLLETTKCLKAELHEGRESWKSQLTAEMERAETCWLEAAEAAARREMKNLEETLTESLGARAQELEKLRSKYDMDSVWESFAHVGKLIRNLEKKFEESGIAPSTPRTTPRNSDRDGN